VKKRHVSMTS